MTSHAAHQPLRRLQRIGLVFAPYRFDEPAGIERSIAALADGLEELGHEVTIIAAGPARQPDDRRVARLHSLQLPQLLHPDTFDAALTQASGLAAELDAIAHDRRFDLVCSMDALWGLGVLGRSRAARTGLMVHVLTGCEPQIRAALRQQPDVVIAPSETVIDQAVACGLAAARWRVVPNALHLAGPSATSVTAPGRDARELLRREGPVRVLTRLAPDKGIVPLLEHFPAWWQRAVEVAVAEASFEYRPGMHAELRRSYHAVAGASPAVRTVPPRPWAQVRPFLAEAALVIVPSLAETFGLVALEALSVGTPVVTYAVGNLPALVRGAGVIVPTIDGPHGLWLAADRLLADAEAYQKASAEGPRRAASFTPAAVAQRWLASFDDTDFDLNTTTTHSDDHRVRGGIA
ncbi:glycosyltransferase family 4 protein [Frankia sp. Cr1]|uniref:glycosyltransferase family 4 protein n=1 Tax=Frankia sp. Cr1 TaxID=3073931 RepID=UPI002AD4C1FD|nr:glycosyltransferase family 4 protein [Frankia sp. Cr1]